jgi:predicted DNA-binding transcriptional regulator AlpA
MSEKRCYTVQELQEILGVSRPTIYNLLKKKESGNMWKAIQTSCL